MEQKLKQDIQIGETIRSLRMERKLTQDQVVSKLQLMDLDITRSIYSQIEGGTYSIRISVLGRNHPLPAHGAETDAGPGGFQTAAYGSGHHPEHLLSD